MNTFRMIKDLPTHSMPSSFLARVDTIVEKNLSNEQFCMADLEENLFMSSSQIYRKIKHQTNCSPSVYIRNIRLKHAYGLIVQTELSISEISYKVGFNGLPYFSRCFSDKFGFPPSELRI